MSCGLQVLFSNCPYFVSSNSSSPLSLLRSHYFLYFFILRSHYFFFIFYSFFRFHFAFTQLFLSAAFHFFSRLHFILHSYNFSSLRILCSDFYFMCSPYFSYFLILISHCFSYFLFFLLHFIMRLHNFSSLWFFYFDFTLLFLFFILSSVFHYAFTQFILSPCICAVISISFGFTFHFTCKNVLSYM